MKALIWKEYRQGSRLVLGIASLLAVPYVIVLVVFALEKFKTGDVSNDEGLVDWIRGASIGSLYVTVLLVPFVAGNSFAGERADRSAEFLAYLPIGRRMTITAKAIYAIGLCLAMGAVNSLISLVTAWYGAAPAHVAIGELMHIAAPTGAFIFGVAWFFSSWVKSPSTAAATGLAAGIVLPMALELLENAGILTQDEAAFRYVAACWTLATTFFVAGIVCYLCRIEP